jgi:hypothetical protein
MLFSRLFNDLFHVAGFPSTAEAARAGNGRSRHQPRKEQRDHRNGAKRENSRHTHNLTIMQGIVFRYD